MLYTYNLTLADTIPYMNSSDYKDRFIGEYWQTRIRYDKLHDMTVRYEAGKLNFLSGTRSVGCVPDFEAGMNFRCLFEKKCANPF